jgi:uncharacterized protein (TIGR03437 family)
MNRHALAVLTFLVLAASLRGQDVSNIQILTEPAGVEYLVDGQRYRQPTSFLWPKGSKHVVSIANAIVMSSGTPGCSGAETTPVQYDSSCSTRYGFSGWETNAGSLANSTSTTQIVTADPAVSFLKAKFSVEYRVSVATANQPSANATNLCGVIGPLGPRPSGAGPGIVYIGSTCIAFAQSLWLPAGEYPLQAVPFEGFVFRGWSFDGGVTTAFVTVLKITGPTTIHPMFEPGKRVRLYTEPYELQLRIDRTIIPTVDPRYLIPKYPVPGYFDWARGTSHILGAVSPQTSLDGKTWVFDKWSNGGGQDMVYNVGEVINVPEELTAKFVRGVSASIMTQPTTMRVKVDGRDNIPYTFVWKVGEKVALSAPAEQTDARGRKYRFKEWSNGGPASQEISVDESHLEQGIRLTAIYEALPQVVVQSTVAGVMVKVDGANCASPCRIDRPSGETVRVSVPEAVTISNVTRWELVGWNDGSSTERVLTFDQDSQTVIANYRKANRLIAILDPEDAAVVHTDPASPDGFYPSDYNVRITLEPKPGFKFRRWDGDLSGTFAGGTVSMANSRIVRAFFERVPFVREAGVRNAAGITTETGVAAGSLISIFGGGLSDRFEVGSGNPLPQMLGGVVVLLGDRILPLVYVSPEQINAVLPGDLQPGNYSLIVRPQGLADVNVQFTVVRNAPGIFANSIESKAYAVAQHADGSAVTLANPAKPDETITICGTGFGPYERGIVDGFMVPSSPPVTLADQAEIRMDGMILQPVWAGAMPGFSGVAAARVKLTGVPSGLHELKIAVNNVESNPVVLPVQ